MIEAESQITQSLMQYLQTELNQKPIVLNPETALIETGLIDSLSIFKLILFMEEHFAVKIQPDDIALENFATIKALATFVQAKQQREVNQSA